MRCIFRLFVITLLMLTAMNLLFGIALIPKAQAAFANPGSVLLGERAAGMSGAFTALTGDPAATPYYNPATSVLEEGNRFSASASAFNKNDTSMGETGNLTTAPQQINRGFFRGRSNGAGSIVSFGSFAFGLSIIVPDSDSYSGQIKGTGTTTSSVNYSDESLWVGGTFSTRVTETDSAGITFYYTARDLARTASDRVVASDNSGATITTEEKNLTSNAVVAVLGYHHRFNEHWSLGLAYRAPSISMAGEASYYRATTQTTPYSATVINRGSLRAITRVPSRFAAGIAREVKDQNTVSFDVQVYEGLSYTDLPELASGSDDIRYNQIMDFALGFEQHVTERAAIRVGAFTNFSSFARPVLTSGQRQGDHVDMYGFSSNMTYQTPQKTFYTFGGYYTGGVGDSVQLTDQQMRLVPKSAQVFTMLVATGFAF